MIKASEARKQQQINEAEGEASAIMAVATATAEGMRRVAEAIKVHGGHEAMQLRVAEQYIAQFGELAKKSNTLVLPANVADVGSMIALAMKMLVTESKSLKESESQGVKGVGKSRGKSRGVGESRVEESVELKSRGVAVMANERTVLITGATGKQGGATVRAVAGKGFTLRAMTRHPESDAAKAVAVGDRCRDRPWRSGRRGVAQAMR